MTTALKRNDEAMCSSFLRKIWSVCVPHVCVCVCLRYEAMKWRKREWKRNIDLINDILIWMLILIYDYIFYTPVLRLHCLNCSKRKSDVWLFKHRRRTKSAKQFCSMQSTRKQSHLYSPNVLIRHHTMCVSMCVCVCVWKFEIMQMFTGREYQGHNLQSVSVCCTTVFFGFYLFKNIVDPLTEIFIEVLSSGYPSMEGLHI